MNASLNQIYTLKLFIAFEMAYSCWFSIGGNLEIQNSSKKSFLTSTTGKRWKENCF